MADLMSVTLIKIRLEESMMILDWFMQFKKLKFILKLQKNRERLIRNCKIEFSKLSNNIGPYQDYSQKQLKIPVFNRRITEIKNFFEFAILRLHTEDLMLEISYLMKKLNYLDESSATG